MWHGKFSSLGFLLQIFLENRMVAFKPFTELFTLLSGRSLCFVAIWQLFSRGSRGRFDGSYHDTFSGSNNQSHDPFTEFRRHNDGHFSSRFYKIFSEVVFQHVKYISFHLSFHFILWSSTYSIGSQVFQQETNMRANDIEVNSEASFSFILNCSFFFIHCLVELILYLDLSR